MMTIVRLLLLSLFIFKIIFSQHITDIIQPLRLYPNRVDTILVSDLFYAPSYDLTFVQNKHLTVHFRSGTKQLIISPKQQRFGATVLEFTTKGKQYHIPVLLNTSTLARTAHTFRYRPNEKVSSVVVTGSFNGWNKENDRLTDTDGDGVYELTMWLEPGSYIYKFLVEGKEILDPANPEKSPTGFDDFNSVLRITESDTTKIFLHVGKFQKQKGIFSYSFIYENPHYRKNLTEANIIALLDNQKIESKHINISHHTIEFEFKPQEVKGKKVLRVLVTADGKNSNLQQVQLFNGEPVGGKQHLAAWEDGVIYSIMIDRFNNGDPSNDNPIVHDSLFWQANYQGGDFRGIIKKIEEGYFDSLGVNILWLSPVYDNPNTAFREYPPPHRWYSGYHGYWPVNDTAVEEKFGTIDELKELIAKAHKRNIKVLLDIVAHHVHIDNPLYTQHPEWFGTLELPDGRKNLRLWDEHRLTTWFEPYMPSFDYMKSREPIEFMTKNCIWWLRQTGADGFRHDAVKHVPNEFWRALTERLKREIEVPEKRTVYQIGETFGDYSLVASYVNNGQLNAQFNFNLSYFAIPVFIEPERSFASVDFHMRKSFEAFGYYNLMGNIMDSHDKVRFMAYADGDVTLQGVDTRELAWTNPPTVDHPDSYKKAALYYAYLFTIPGLPVVYYGSEFGMTGADDPDNRRMMRFGDSLTVHEQQMWKETQKIIRLRNKHSSLRYGDFYTLKADENIYAYVRSDFNERLLIILNKNLQEQQVTITIPSVYGVRTLHDVVNEEQRDVNNNMVSVTMSGLSWRVFKLQH